MYNVYTTFAPKDYPLYGKNCIETFIEYWPEDIKLYVYYEGEPELENDRVVWLDFNTECSDQLIFAEYAKKYPQDSFYKGATRFSYKAYTIINHLEKRLDRYNIWLDGDCTAIKKIPLDWLNKIKHDSCCVSTLLRKTRAAESGFILADNQHEDFNLFLEKYSEFYRGYKLFDLPEWHDGFILSHVIGEFKIKTFNLTPSNTKYAEWHPFVRGVLGEYLDHLKGPRKNLGFSRERLDVWN